MKTFVYFLTAALLFAASIRADDITLADGKTVFHKAKIISHDAATVTIKHSTGIARVMIMDLPPELRAQFKYDPDAAKQEAAQEQQARENYNAQAAAEFAHRAAIAAWNKAAATLSGKVLSVAHDGVILMGTGFGTRDDDIVFVRHVQSGLADDDRVSIVAVPDGTYQYSSASSAYRTIPAFDAARP